MSFLARYLFGQHMLFPRKHGRALVNTCSDAFCVLALMGGFCPIQVELNFVFSLAWEMFGQSKVRYILSQSWHGRGLVNTVDIHFVS